MPFVKLDCGMVDSTIWMDREAREIFITALLMASPREFLEPVHQLKVNEIAFTGFEVPPGWYGFVGAAGPGIVRRAGLEQDAGMLALERLGRPDTTSRSKEHEGRRMIRMDGGYLILNYMRYRDRDYGAAERMRKLRARRKASSSYEQSSRDGEQLHIAESREQSTDKKKTDGRQAGRFTDFWRAYPKKVKKKTSEQVWKLKRLDATADEILKDVKTRLEEDKRWQRGFIPDPPTYLRGERWNDEISQ